MFHQCHLFKNKKLNIGENGSLISKFVKGLIIRNTFIINLSLEVQGLNLQYIFLFIIYNNLYLIFNELNDLLQGWFSISLKLFIIFKMKCQIIFVFNMLARGMLCHPCVDHPELCHSGHFSAELHDFIPDSSMEGNPR